MRVLILGGTRFVGPPVVRRLVALGHEVAVFHRGQTKASLPTEVWSFHGNREQLNDYSDDFRAYKPDVVLDTLSMTEQDAKAVMTTFTGLAPRLVVLSSGDVYRAYDRFTGKDPGPLDPTPLTEDSPLRDKLFHYQDAALGPDDRAYHYDKILVERIVTSRPDELPATVLRLPMVYGPGDYQHRLFTALKRMDDQRPFILLAKDMATWRGLRGYVDDIAEAIALCVVSKRALGRVYHVAEERRETDLEWLKRIARAAGWRGEIVTLPNEQMPKHLQHAYVPSQDWSLDSSRIRQELGYSEPTPPADAMYRTISWERANPPQNIDPARFDYAAEDALMAQLRR